MPVFVQLSQVQFDLVRRKRFLPLCSEQNLLNNLVLNYLETLNQLYEIGIYSRPQTRKDIRHLSVIGVGGKSGTTFVPPNPQRKS